jgi:hypothetical protein
MLGATVQNLAARATRLLGFVNPCFIEPENSLPYSQHPAILSQLNPVDDLPFYVFKIQFNIILPSMSMAYKQAFSFRFSHKNPLCFSLLPHMCPFHVPWFDPQHLVKFKNHEIPRCVIFFSLLLLPKLATRLENPESSSHYHCLAKWDRCEHFALHAAKGTPFLAISSIPHDFQRLSFHHGRPSSIPR